MRFKTLTFALVSIAGLFCVGLLLTSHSATAQGNGAAPVRIVSPVPVPVQDVGQIPRTPFQQTMCSGLPQSCADPSRPTTFTLPVNQRLVVEYVSVSCLTFDAPALLGTLQFGSTVGQHFASHFFAPTPVFSSP